MAIDIMGASQSVRALRLELMVDILFLVRHVHDGMYAVAKETRREKRMKNTVRRLVRLCWDQINVTDLGEKMIAEKRRRGGEEMMVEKKRIEKNGTRSSTCAL